MRWDGSPIPGRMESSGTPDGKKLYVNKWYYDNKGGTWVFDIKRDGTLTNMRKFTDWGGDGMSMDEEGNVYISNGTGVMAFDPDGNNILNIPIAGGATNNTFAGRNGKVLFITGPSDRVTAIRMNVKGAEELRSRFSASAQLASEFANQPAVRKYRGLFCANQSGFCTGLLVSFTDCSMSVATPRGSSTMAT